MALLELVRLQKLFVPTVRLLVFLLDEEQVLAGLDHFIVINRCFAPITVKSRRGPKLERPHRHPIILT